MSDGQQAEQLWLKAHEQIKQGNLAQAVRDLAACYEMLKALKDPRLAQVHRRWVEVHKLYQERKARAAAGTPAQAAAPAASRPQPAQAAAQPAAAQPAAAQPAAAQPAVAQAKPAAEPIRVEPRFSQAEARTLGEQAEAAANAGNLEQAISLYGRVLQDSPTNELAKERLAELRAAAARKTEMSGAQQRPAHPAATLPAGPIAAAPGAATDDVAFLEGLLRQVHERRRAI